MDLGYTDCALFLIHLKIHLIRVICFGFQAKLIALYVFDSLKEPSHKSHLFMDWATLVMLYVFDSLNKPAHNSHSLQ